MVKVILMVKRRPDLTREQFQGRYENGHAPLAARNLKHCVGYVRNFVTEPEDWRGPDCLTEFWYDLDGPWSEARDLVTTEAVRAELAADEAEFMDRSSMQVMVVEERTTSPIQLLGRPVP